MAFTYQGFATLGVNLNRQKYGPLDVSTVFISVADLTYYTSKGTIVSEEVSLYLLATFLSNPSNSTSYIPSPRCPL